MGEGVGPVRDGVGLGVILIVGDGDGLSEDEGLGDGVGLGVILIVGEGVGSVRDGVGLGVILIVGEGVGLSKNPKLMNCIFTAPLSADCGP